MTTKLLRDLKVAELRIELEERDLDTSGRKEELRTRLREALEAAGEDPDKVRFEIPGSGIDTQTMMEILIGFRERMLTRIEESSRKVEEINRNMIKKTEESSRKIEEINRIMIKKTEENSGIVKEISRIVANTTAVGPSETTDSAQPADEDVEREQEQVSDGGDDDDDVGASASVNEVPVSGLLSEGAVVVDDGCSDVSIEEETVVVDVEEEIEEGVQEKDDCVMVSEKRIEPCREDEEIESDRKQEVGRSAALRGSADRVNNGMDLDSSSQSTALLRLANGRSDSGVSSSRSGGCAGGDGRSGSGSGVLRGPDKSLPPSHRSDAASPLFASERNTGGPRSVEPIRVWRDLNLLLESELHARRIPSVLCHVHGFSPHSFVTVPDKFENGMRGCCWIELPAGKYCLHPLVESPGLSKTSRCSQELDIAGDAFVAHSPECEWAGVAPYYFLSFDIENAGRRRVFPEPEIDPVIQITNKLKLDRFEYLGRLIADGPSAARSKVSQSRLLGRRVNKHVNVEGRTACNMLVVARRIHKLRSYTHNNVSQKGLKEQMEEPWRRTPAVGKALRILDRRRLLCRFVTKQLSYRKPTYADLWKSLQEWKANLLSDGVRKLAIPRLSCGFNRLDWGVVRSILEVTLRDTSISVLSLERRAPTSQERSVDYYFCRSGTCGQGKEYYYWHDPFFRNLSWDRTGLRGGQCNERHPV